MPSWGDSRSALEKKLRKTLSVAKLGGVSDEVASPKISVVVPVYKVEKYLRDCVESVLAQSFEDFELILVDDGSPDRSGEICDEFAKKDSRIRVFHQENGGVTSARRHGVERARGEWVTFVDADDLLPPNALKDLFDEADDDVDWVQGGMQRFNDGETQKEETRTGKVTSFDVAGLTENMLLHHIGPWGKIVRRKLFTPNVLDISRDINVGEDVLMNLRLIANRPRKAKGIDKVVYFYRRQGGSVCYTYLRTENYIFRHIKLLRAEMRKISEPSNREQLSRAFSQYFCTNVAILNAYGLPIKFPHRLATLIRRGAKSKPRYFFVYLCLRFNCLWIARLATNIFFFLRGEKLDATSKTLLE